MQFGSIHLVVLLIIPLGLMLLFRAEGSWKRTAQALFSEHALFAQLARGYSERRVWVKNLLLVVAFVCMVLSVMQPKWGYHWEEVTRKGIDIVIALDLSTSMLAEDVKPNRLTRAKMEIKNLISRLEGDRIGLVGFSGNAFVHCPLTLDYATAKLFLDDLDTDTLPLPGTDIGGAIQKAMTAFEGVDEQNRVLVLMTDGEDHEQKVLDIVKEAEKKRVIIYTIGVGSSMGAPIPITDERGNTSYVKNSKGEVVLSKMDSELLQKIALLTGGKKGSLTGASFPLEEMYDAELSKFEKRELGSTRQKKFENRYQVPLMIALVLLIVELVVPTRKEIKD